MKIGILSASAQCVALLRQLVTGRECIVYADVPGLIRARDEDVGLLVLDLEGLNSEAAQLESALTAFRQPLPAEQSPVPPVLLLAAPAQKALLQALRAAGADDYLLKPIRRNELALRLELLLLEIDPQDDSARTVDAAGFHFDMQRLRVSSASRPVPDTALTRKEIELALLLLQHMGRPLSRAFIQERIWGAEPELPTRTIDTHVSRVRSKLGLKPEHGFRLATVYGYGYQLESLEQ